MSYPQFSRLANNQGNDVMLHNASLRWCDGGGEKNYQGDVWLEQIDRTEVFRLVFQAREITWLATPSSKVKTKGDLAGGILYLPAGGQSWSISIAKRKSVVNKRKLYAIHLQFEPNNLTMEWLQLSVEVFNGDTSEGELFREALVYANIERVAVAGTAQQV